MVATAWPSRPFAQPPDAGSLTRRPASARTLKWYVFNEPGGAIEAAIAACNKEAEGRYNIQIPAPAHRRDQQRELIVRRLAADDDSSTSSGWT